jgi:hypothetical protein
VAILTNNDGMAQGIAAVVRDDTERFLTDRTMKMRIAELEAKT